MRIINASARGSGGPTAKSATVPSSTGPIYTISRVLGSTSSLSLITGTNANLTLSGTTISATAAITAGASQTAVVREVNGTLAAEYPVVLTALSTLAASPSSAMVSTSATPGTLVASLSNVPTGVTPTISPNDGRLVIGGSAGAWTVLVGLTAASAGSQTFTISATGATSCTVAVTFSAAQFIGGLAVGTAGSRTLDSGYTLMAGDDFDSALDIIGPSNPNGRYATTKGGYAISGSQYRTSSGLAMYDVDPLHTGHNNSNKGSPVSAWANSITQTGSVITCNARSVTASDLPYMEDPTKLAIGSMIHTGSYLLANAPCIMEARVKWNATLHSHMTWWFMQVSATNGFRTYDDVEVDFEGGSAVDGSGDGRVLDYNINFWNSGTPTTNSTSGVTVPNDSWRCIAMRADESGNVTFWRDSDGTGNTYNLQKTYTGATARVLAGAFYMLMTAHAYQAGWQAGDPDASISMDWLRVWSKGGTHYTPLVSGSTYNVDFGASASWTLPTTTTVWGSAVTEQVAALGLEANEPGGAAFGNYALLPTGFAYNSGTNVLSCDGTNTKPGRLLIERIVRQAGASCVPQRVFVNVGPVINLNDTIPVPQSTAGTIDIYSACDCGQLFPALGTNITVTGLPAGASYNSATGILSYNLAAGTYSGITVSVTNSVGQTASKTLAIQSANIPWSGDANLIGWFEAENTSDFTFSAGSTIALWLNRASGNGNLAAVAGLPAPTRATAAINGVAAVRFVRDGTGTGNTILRTGNTTVPIAALRSSATDPDSTRIYVFKTASATTGIPGGWSVSGATTTAQRADGIIRRSGSSSDWRNGDNSTGPATALGTIADSAVHIVVLKRSGGADSVWINSLTPTVNGVTSSRTLSFAGCHYSLGALLGTTNTTEQQAGFGGDMAVNLIFNSAKSDAFIQSCISALATKYGVTLV